MVTSPCGVWCGVIVSLDFCRSVAKKTKKNRTAALLSFWFFVSPLRRKTGKNLTNLYTNSFIFFCPLFIPMTMPCPVLSFSSLQNCFLFVTLKFNLKILFCNYFFCPAMARISTFLKTELRKNSKKSKKRVKPEHTVMLLEKIRIRILTDFG